MIAHSFRQYFAATCTSLLLAVCCLCGTVPAVSSAASGQTWTANGAGACAKYLTPDVMAAILVVPDGQPQQIDAQSCHTGIIYISLKIADTSVFRQELVMIAGVHLMSGVGDAAYWNEAGAISAAKGRDRGCDISIVGVPGQLKIHNAALGEKLGGICNKLFALP